MLVLIIKATDAAWVSLDPKTLRVLINAFAKSVVLENNIKRFKEHCLLS